MNSSPLEDRSSADNPLGRINSWRDGHIWHIAIDRPKKYNGMTQKMLTELAEAYQAFEDSDARCAVLSTTGAHFTAGLDLPNIDRSKTLFPRALVDPVGLYPPFRSKPVVAAVRGICFTIGLELALAADVIIAGDDSRFAMLEVKRGIMPTCGANTRLVERAGWGNAMRYLLTGEEFNADDAYRMNIATQIVPADDVTVVATALAERIAKQAPLAVQEVWKNAWTFVQDGHEAATAQLDAASIRLRDSDDAKEGFRSFVERRDANFTGR